MFDLNSKYFFVQSDTLILVKTQFIFGFLFIMASIRANIDTVIRGLRVNY